MLYVSCISIKNKVGGKICVRCTLIFGKQSNFKPRASHMICRVHRKMKTQGPGQGQGPQSFLPTAYHPNPQQMGDRQGTANTTRGCVQYLNARGMSSPLPSHLLHASLGWGGLLSPHLKTPRGARSNLNLRVRAQAPAGGHRAHRPPPSPRRHLVTALAGPQCKWCQGAKREARRDWVQRGKKVAKNPS